MTTPLRDRDVRDAIVTDLMATGQFDGVYIWGLPEDYGTGASRLAVCAIEPLSSTQRDLWDGGASTGIVVTSVVTLTFLYRQDDPQLRDEGAELLVNTAIDALNGASLAGLTLPDMTRVTSWRWGVPTAPERMIQATFTYEYIVEGWAGYGVTP